MAERPHVSSSEWDQHIFLFVCSEIVGSSSVRFADTLALGNPQAGWLSLLSVSLALRRKATELWPQSPTTCSLSLLVNSYHLHQIYLWNCLRTSALALP